ncbi:MAG: hypothetical protein QM704_20450 [Anaeromyxobacteraceae bacterium]
MRIPLLVAVAVVSMACGGEEKSPRDYSTLWSMEAGGPSCPTADLVEDFGVSWPTDYGTVALFTMRLCRWDCSEGELVLARFLSTPGEDDWWLEGVSTGACVPRAGAGASTAELEPRAPSP